MVASAAYEDDAVTLPTRGRRAYLGALSTPVVTRLALVAPSDYDGITV